MLLNETFGVFNRLASLRSSKKITGKEVEKIFKKLERALTKYYDLSEVALEQQLDMLMSSLKTFQGTRFENLEHVQEMKKNYELTKKALGVSKQLKSKFASAKGKAYDFKFNSDKEGAINLEGLEDGIKKIMSKTTADLQNLDDELAKQATKQAPSDAKMPQADTVKPSEDKPIDAPWEKTTNDKKDILSAPWDNAATPAAPPAAPPLATPPAAPAAKPIKDAKTDKSAQDAISKLLDEFIAKNKSLVAESEVDEEILSEAAEKVLIDDLLTSENIAKLKNISFESKNTRKAFKKKLKDILASMGYSTTVEIHLKQQERRKQLPTDDFASKVAPAPATPAPATGPLPITKEQIENAKQHKEFENLKKQYQNFMDVSAKYEKFKNSSNQSLKDQYSIKTVNSAKNSLDQIKNMIPEFKALSIKDLEKVLKV
jgi:hypothetical protein